MHDALNYIKNFAQIIVRNLVKVLFLVPIKKNRILFTSFKGEKIADNPKYIYDYLFNKYKDSLEYIWVFNGDKRKAKLNESVKIVTKNSLKWFFYMETSKVIVDNYPPALIIPPRKGQMYIETWHAGGAYKRIGQAYDAKGEAQRESTDVSMKIVNLFVSSSLGFTMGTIEQGYNYKGQIIKCGMPRNDIFFNKIAIQYMSDKIRTKYSLKNLVVLYAPTFRGETDKINKIDYVISIDQLKEALKFRYGINADILVRCHYLDENKYDFGDDVINVGEYPDMQELLCVADILITDYSSCMWDYALLGRPCLLYTPDIDMYIKERGFFTMPEEWPGIICRNMDELCETIINLDEKECAERARRHLEIMGSYEEGHATEIISDRIIGYINGV